MAMLQASQKWSRGSGDIPNINNNVHGEGVSPVQPPTQSLHIKTI